MFWRKKREADGLKKKISEPADIKAWVGMHSESFADTVKGLEQELAKIRANPDAGAQYLALDKFEKKIGTVKEAAIAQMAERLSRKNEYWKNARDFVPTIILIPFLGIGLLIFDEAVSDNKRKGHAERCATVAAAANETGFFKAFDQLCADVKPLKSDILQSRMPDIALSPHFDELYGAFPELKDAFVRASARQRAAEGGGSRLDKPVLKKPTTPTADI